MRIAIDAHTIGQQATGNETYIHGLTNGLARVDTTNSYLLYIAPDAETSTLPTGPKISTRELHPNHRILRIPFTLPYRLLQDKADLLHVTYIGPPVASVPVIATIHDMSFMRYPEYFTNAPLLSRVIPWAAKRAAHVITISEFSRQDIISFCKVEPSHVTAFPLGVDTHFAPVERATSVAVAEKYGVNGPYLLYVGNLQPRKNVPRIIGAYKALLASGNTTHSLVIVGKKAWLASESLRAARESSLGDKLVITGYIPDEDLPALYSGATALVFPSVFEGFGLPIVEAMACGTPTITSFGSALEEVAGDAAILVDPFNEGAIMQAMARLIGDADLRDQLRRRGLARSKLFSWDDTARGTIRIYERFARKDKG